MGRIGSTISLEEQVHRLALAGPRWTDAMAMRLPGRLTLGADSEGLYLATLPFFPLFHPPGFIPWNEVSMAKKNLFFVSGVRLQLGKELSVPLWIRERLAERLRDVAGSGHPVETLG